MILAEYIVSVATAPGPASHEHIAISVIKFSTAAVGLIVTGLLLAIIIRGIWRAFYNGTEFGTWPGLKKWIGRKSTTTVPMPVKYQYGKITMSGTVNKKPKWEHIWEVGHEPFETFPGLTITQDANLPPGKMYILNKKHLVYHPSVASIVNQVMMEAKTEPSDQELHEKLHQEFLKKYTGGFLSTLYEQSDEPADPKSVKFPTGRRTEEVEKISEVLRRHLVPIHFQGGETWLEVKSLNFNYIVLAEEIIDELER